ncbi:MAG: DUF6151 family protein [Arenicella sp.]
MPEIQLECSCGKVQGKTDNVVSSSGTRIVCCCDDCQSFAQYLSQENSVLDQYGGTDIFQMPISKIEIIEGTEQVACVRLSAKGLYRWYTKCCNTPIGNSMGAGVPFIGVIHNFMNNTSTRDDDLGKSRGHIQVKFSRKEIPVNLQGSPFRVILRSLSKLIVWKIKGFNKPSAFFDDDGNPIVEPNILT